jgi:hypothetical protein
VAESAEFNLTNTHTRFAAVAQSGNNPKGDETMTKTEKIDFVFMKRSEILGVCMVLELFDFEGFNADEELACINLMHRLKEQLAILDGPK